MAGPFNSPELTEQSLIRLLLVLALLALERGPWLLIGRIPDRNPYSCSESTSGTYVGPAASITDSMCAVWTMGSGTSPHIAILRNGAQVAGGEGIKIEYYLGIVYVLGSDTATWYSWSDPLSDYQTFGTNDPSMSMVPTGYFVSTTGSDSNTCMQSTNVATPKRHMVNALTCLSAGDTLYARGGDYDEGLSTVPSGVSWSSKIRITNYPSETVWLKPLSNATSAGGIGLVMWFDCNCHYVEFDGINLDGSSLSGGMVVWVSTNNGNNPHHMRFQNAEVIAGDIAGGGAMQMGAQSSLSPPAIGSNELINLTIHGGGRTGECGFACASYGVYLKGPSNLVEGCNIYNTSGAAIQIYNGSATDQSNNNVIRNNLMHDITRTGDVNEVWGVIISGANNQLYNNAIYNISVGAANASNAGIAVGGGSAGNRLYNNTIFNIKNSGIYVDTTATATVVSNNIVYQSTVNNYVNNAGAQTTHTSNLDNGTNPVFVNAASANFRLQISSPAKDAGTSLASFFTTDLESIPRPQGPLWDIGAYEYH